MHFYFQVKTDDCVRSLVALQILDGVKVCNRVDGHLFPQWQYELGHHAQLLVTDAVNIVDAVAIVVDNAHTTFKHLIPSRHHPWYLTILNNYNDIATSLKLRH